MSQQSMNNQPPPPPPTTTKAFGTPAIDANPVILTQDHPSQQSSEEQTQTLATTMMTMPNWWNQFPPPQQYAYANTPQPTHQTNI